MKKFFLLSLIVFVFLTGCIPLLLQDKQEFVVEVVGVSYLEEVKDWYQPSYSDYWAQDYPVIVLYYENNTSQYATRTNFYEQSGDFVAAAGEIVDNTAIKDNLNSIWKSYSPEYDVDVWYQQDAGEWQARVKPLSKDVVPTPNFLFLVEFEKVQGENYYKVTEISSKSPDENDRYHLGNIQVDSSHGFAVFAQRMPSTKVTLESETKILGAEVVWPK
ncbi:hypothetical protein [Thermotoga sp. KOL6]|uniref:hypothetical protein n=1 Tax=Thermotoga sp. KOL6 TaxID=126741 RepID=UPI000C76D635|nr:hypothetical protein [Thermotoga sp. KOL6]PLV58323.1 hypothetical protein AS005_08125 [Thermotoga sp. KOL6]